MRKYSLLCLVLFFPVPLSPKALGDVTAGITIGSGGSREFHLAVCNHYHVDEVKIVHIRKRKVPDEHIPVVFYIAQRAKVPPDRVVELRVQGKSWMEITAHFGLGVDIYYVPVAKVYGPPFGRALGHFKNKKRSEWATIRLADADVVNLVNVKFLSAHYGFTADKIITMRQKGDNFIKLNSRVKVHKAKAVKLQPQKSHPRPSQIKVKPKGPKSIHQPAFRAGGGKQKGKGGGRGRGRGK